VQTQADWVAPVFSFLAMVGSLILFLISKYAAAGERQNIAEQVKLFRRAQAENRLIEVIDQSLKTLRESAYLIEQLRNATDVERKWELRRNLEQLGETLTRLSWRCGPYTDKVARMGHTVTGLGIGFYPQDRSEHAVDSLDKLSSELESWLCRVLSDGLLEPTI